MFKHIVRWGLPLASLGLFLFAVAHVVLSNQESPPDSPAAAAQPPRAPFPESVAGAGLIEAQTENIEVGTPVPGIVAEVFVKVGEKVESGAPLFRLESSELRAQNQVAEAAATKATADLERLRNQPRPEEIPIREAYVREAQARLVAARRSLARIERLTSRGITTEEELDDAQRAADVAAAEVERMQAELALLNAGAWQQDRLVAEAMLEQAKAQVRQGEIDLERRTVKARVDGEVLHVKMRPGQFVGAPPSEPLIVLGNTQQLNVRVDIDEQDIPRFYVGMPGVAMLKGHAGKEFELRFERVEPFVIPKRSLTGDKTERIDTRVLQVIYAISHHKEQLYVGQQLDVYLDATGDRKPPSVELPSTAAGR